MATRKLSSYQVSLKFYDMFFNNASTLSIREYLDNSYCDDICEVDLNNDSYELLYHVEGKYFAPVSKGSFASFF